MHLFSTLSHFATIINGLWIFTLVSMVLLYIICNALPDRIVGSYLPLHNVFKPGTNLDLDYQSIGYAMLHTKWITRITHYTVIFEVMLWFVIFQSWHWGIPIIAFLAILLQSFFIGDKKFGFCFVVMGAATFATAICFIHFLGLPNAVLLSKVLLMLGALIRLAGHSFEMVPPLLVSTSDQFVKLTTKNINYKIPLVIAIGYVAEFGSGLPNRLFPVQVNYLYQTIFRVSPHCTLPWQQVELSAKKVITGGYSELGAMRHYYYSIASNVD